MDTEVHCSKFSNDFSAQFDFVQRIQEFGFVVLRVCFHKNLLTAVDDGIIYSFFSVDLVNQWTKS